jgi:DNA repair protein RecO (recombination protein O)
MKTYKARGIVLHTVKYGDTALVAYLLTDASGRETYMVQGVRSTRGHRNRAALLQPMFLVEFEGLTSPRAEMHRFREMRAAVPLRSIPFDVRKSTVALFMAEMLYRLVREAEPDSPLFDFVWETVRALDLLDSAAGVANFHLLFMVGLSRHLGFFPGNEWSPGWWFDIREGLFTPVEPRGGVYFSRENAELLGRFMEMGPAAVGGHAADRAASDPSLETILTSLPLNRTRRADFMNAMLAYFGYHLDAVRDIRSVDILREVF